MAARRLRLQICWPEKCATAAVALFRTRFDLHNEVYTHKAVKQVEFMVVRALLLADPHYDVGVPDDGDADAAAAAMSAAAGGASPSPPPDKDGGASSRPRTPSGSRRVVRISEAITDMAAFERLDDTLLQRIRWSTDPALAPSRAVIEDIYRRKASERARRRARRASTPSWGGCCALVGAWLRLWCERFVRWRVGVCGWFVCSFSLSRSSSSFRLLGLRSRRRATPSPRPEPCQHERTSRCVSTGAVPAR